MRLPEQKGGCGMGSGGVSQPLMAGGGTVWIVTRDKGMTTGTLLKADKRGGLGFRTKEKQAMCCH